MGNLRVGIVGAGGIAQGAHLPGYQRLQDRVELVAVADVNYERARHMQQSHHFLRAYDDFRRMLAEEDLDAISVCTPNKFHAEVTLAALEAGCHVLCEKPPAMNAAEARAMADAASRSGRILAYGFHYRFSADVRALKRFIDAGDLGEIYAVRVVATRRRGIPTWGVFTSKELQGGGPLIDIGVHMLDAALHVLGYPRAVQVMGSTYTKLGNRRGIGPWGSWDWQNYSVEDLALAMVRLESGATVMVETSFAAHIPKDEFNVYLLGTEGGAQLFPLTLWQERHDALVDVNSAWLPGRGVEEHHAEIEAFVSACRGGPREPLCGPEEGVRVQEIVDAVYRSAEAGAAIGVTTA